MQTKIAVWGNSNAVRLPAELMAAAGLKAGASVKLTSTPRGVLIEPTRPRYSLETMLDSYDPKKHQLEEIDWGKDAGRESGL